MDKNAIIKALRDYAQATSNEVANTVAAPIDIINAGLGYVGLGSNEPVGGSAWMRKQGLTAPVPEGMAQTLGETTGLVLPMVGAMKAKEIATALRGMGENIAKPKGGGMAGGQRGAIDLGAPQGPQAEAIKLAQQRAALPISKGGLGLPANNSAAQRAEAMGFDIEMPLYHGTGDDFKAFDPLMAGKNDKGLWGKGQYLTTSPVSASSYALRKGDGANIIPAYAAVKNPMRVTTGSDLITRMPDGTNTRTLIGNNLDGSKIKEIAEAAGHDGVFQVKPDGNIGDIVTFNPDNIRSRFAAFDPFRKTAAIAAAMGVAAPDLLAKEKQPTPPQNLVKALRNGN